MAALLAVGAASALSPAAPAAPTAPRVAALGIELPTIGITLNHSWVWTFDRYFSPAVADDIANNLHADYVRTGWIPNWDGKRHPWLRETEVLDSLCGEGLHVMIIVPGVESDVRGEGDALQSVRDFFTHFTQREPGCIRYAEIGNESNLPVNGYRSADEYATYYAEVAPIVASFGIPVITSGVSGADTPWIAELGRRLRAVEPPPPAAGFGFHPYGVPAGGLPLAVNAMREAAGSLPDGSMPAMYITEIGRSDPGELYRTILTLAPVTPAVTIYEYKAQPGESDSRYALVDHPALYEAVRAAAAQIAASSR